MFVSRLKEDFSGIYELGFFFLWEDLPLVLHKNSSLLAELVRLLLDCL